MVVGDAAGAVSQLIQEHRYRLQRMRRRQQGQGSHGGEIHETLTMPTTPAPDACTRARREGLDGGHAPAGITLMAGEAWAYLMRGRPVRLQSTSQTSIRNSSGRRLPAPRLVSSAIVRAAAWLQGRNRCPGLRVPERRAGRS